MATPPVQEEVQCPICSGKAATTDAIVHAAWCPNSLEAEMWIRDDSDDGGDEQEEEH